MFRPFYSAIIRQKHKYVFGKISYGRGFSFAFSMIKYIKLAIIPNKGMINTEKESKYVQTQFNSIIMQNYVFRPISDHPQVYNLCLKYIE
jgi:hypothetical protein